MVTRDIQTLWQFVKFSLMVFLHQVFFLPFFPLYFFSFLFKQPKCARGFLELAVNRSLRKAKFVLVFNCSVFLCFNRSLKTCFKKQKEKKKHAKGNSVQGLQSFLGGGRRIPRVNRVLRSYCRVTVRPVLFTHLNGFVCVGEEGVVQCHADLKSWILCQVHKHNC